MLDPKELRLAATVAAWMLLAATASAQVPAKPPIDVAPMADKILGVLKQHGKTEVAMGDFVGPPQSNASAGPAIKLGLIRELSEQGIKIKSRNPWGITGRYRLADLGGGAIGVQLEGRIETRSGSEIFAETWDLGGEPSIVAFFGPTVALPLDQGEVARGKKLIEGVEDPKATIKGTRVSAAADSPYAVEVAIIDGGSTTPLKPVDDGGLAFAPIKRGQKYVVTLMNDSDEDAAVTVTIDGVNIFAFSKNEAYKHVILPKKSKGTIKGWHRTNEVSDSFLITELAKGVSADLGASGGDIGTITASFASAWPKDAPAPKADEPLLASRGAGNATARGPEVRAKFTEVERRVGATRAVVSIRYDKSR